MRSGLDFQVSCGIEMSPLARGHGRGRGRLGGARTINRDLFWDPLILVMRKVIRKSGIHTSKGGWHGKGQEVIVNKGLQNHQVHGSLSLLFSLSRIDNLQMLAYGL